MTTALTKVENGPWSEADLKLIMATVAKGATDSEFKLFLYTAVKYGLDPLIKQIWCVKYGDRPAAIFTGRDGFLAIAHRSGQFDGMETQAIRDEKGKLLSALCRVWRKDMTHPFVVEVPFAEYDQSVAAGQGKPNNWNKLPETMLKKVAESQCLRRAFNISGIYEPSEYDPAADESAPPKLPARTEATQAEPLPAEEQLRLLAKGFHKAIGEAANLEELKAIARYIKLSIIPENHPLRDELKQDYKRAETAFTSKAVSTLTPEPETDDAPVEVTPAMLERECPSCGGIMELTGNEYRCTAKGCGHTLSLAATPEFWEK